MRITKVTWIIGGLLYVLSHVLFMINLQFPRWHNFDEFHYVPAAKSLLSLETNRNWEHPPLGKYLIAAGIVIGKDKPFGWRFMSTLFGALTVVAMFCLGLTLFRSLTFGVTVALLSVFNQMLYVQSRIAMLDGFMFCFIAWALVAFSVTWNLKLPAKSVKKAFLATGILLGLGLATKWFTVVAWVTILGIVGWIKLQQKWGVRFKTEKKRAKPSEEWYSPQLWKGVRGKSLFKYLILVPLLIYFLSFVPLLFVHDSHYGVLDIFTTMQEKMYSGQLRVGRSHPYQSRWWDWPLMKRPIWFAFDKEPANPALVRGVLCLGNPLIMISGLIALMVCFYSWIMNRSRQGFFILIFYSAFYFSWTVIPRKISFYYYYFPAAMMLSLAIPYVFYRYVKPKFQWTQFIFVAAAFGFFVYFFPILAALKIKTAEFSNWMWFTSWI